MPHSSLCFCASPTHLPHFHHMPPRKMVCSVYDTCSSCHREAERLSRHTLYRCTRCKVAFYCSQSCQQRSWKSHKRVCHPRPDPFALEPPSHDIPSVHVAGGRNRPFSPSVIIVASYHPVWKMGSLSPVSQILGFPLLVWRVQEEVSLQCPNDAEKDNQSITFLMIDPETGFASARWQKNIGPAVVVRADRRPLTPAALEIIWMYIDKVIITGFEDDRNPPLEAYTREAFDQFCEEYKETSVLSGGRQAERFKALTLPL